MNIKIRKKRGCKVWVNVAIEIGGKILPSLQYRVKVLSGREIRGVYYYTTELGEYSENEIYENALTARSHSYIDATKNVYFMKHVKNA